MRSNTNLTPPTDKFTRKEYNLMILDHIRELVKMCPEQRFGQIISNYIFPERKDPFYEESEETWTNLQKVVENLKESLKSRSYERV